MSLTKHKIFKIEIKNNFDIEEITLNQLNEFIEDSNHVYMNHSISILIESIEKYGSIYGENKYLIISLIYKDLNSTSLSLKNTGKKIKSIVTKEVKSGGNLKEPDMTTDFDVDFVKTKEKIDREKSDF